MSRAENGSPNIVNNINSFNDNASYYELFNQDINIGGTYEGDDLYLPLTWTGYRGSQLFEPIKITPTGQVETKPLPKDLKYLIKYRKNFAVNGKNLSELSLQAQELKNILSTAGLNLDY